MLDFYVSQVLLNGPEGELDAEGLTFESPLDMRYTKSSVCESLKLIQGFIMRISLLRGANGLRKDVGCQGL